MGERHAPTARHRSRLEKFEDTILRQRIKKKRTQQHLNELDQAFGDALTALLTTRPTRAIGMWRQPTDKQVNRARKLILARILVYAQHDPKKVGDARFIRKQIAALQRSITQTTTTLGKLTRRTRTFIRLRDRDMPPTLDDLRVSLTRIERDIGLLQADFTAEPKEIAKSSAKALLEFVALVYLDATGVFPATSTKTSMPDLHRSDAGDFRLIAAPAVSTKQWRHDNSPPVLQLVKCAVDAVERGRATRRAQRGQSPPHQGRSAKLRANAFEAIVNEIRESTFITS